MKSGFSRIPKKVGVLLRSHFFAGILVIIPIGVIAWILGTVLGLLWQIQDILPTAWQADNLLQHQTLALLVKAAFTIGAALLLALAVSVFGWASKHFLGKKVLELFAEIIEHIPVVRSIYSALDQLLKTLASNSAQQFSRVVYFEYPRKGVWVIAFVTGPAKSKNLPSNHLNIYVPTTPNPTSGFHLIVPESEVRDSNLTVEEAFKTLLSLGIAQTCELTSAPAIPKRDQIDVGD